MFLIIQFMSMQPGWAASQLPLFAYNLQRGPKFAKETSFDWNVFVSTRPILAEENLLYHNYEYLVYTDVQNGKRYNTDR